MNLPHPIRKLSLGPCCPPHGAWTLCPAYAKHVLYDTIQIRLAPFEKSSDAWEFDVGRVEKICGKTLSGLDSDEVFRHGLKYILGPGLRHNFTKLGWLYRAESRSRC
jgi:hypothetical protein